MTNKTNEELLNIVAENEVFNRIIIEASERGLFAGGYAIDKSALYHEARHELERRGIKVEG